MEKTILPISNKRLPRWARPIRILYHDKRIPMWCGLPYPGHPKGCPNFGNQPDRCPPHVPYITEIFDLSKPMWLAFSEFDLSDHIKSMRIKHPTWSEPRLRCVLYWQSRSKNQMKTRAKALMKHVEADCVHYMAEAIGVQMYRTAFSNDIVLERIRDITICKHIAMIGFSKKE